MHIYIHHSKCPKRLTGIARANEFQATAGKARRPSASHPQDAQFSLLAILAVAWKTDAASLPGAGTTLWRYLWQHFEIGGNNFPRTFCKNAPAAKNNTPRPSSSQRRARRAAARCPSRCGCFCAPANAPLYTCAMRCC